MKQYWVCLSLSLGVAAWVPTLNSLPAAATVSPNPPLVVTPTVPETLGWDDQLWGTKGDRRSLLAAIDYSLRYLQTDRAVAAYRQYSVPGITRDRVQRSLVRFRQLVVASRTPAELQAAVQREFVFYQAIGKDHQGTVSFTGYFEPVYAASRTPSAEYRYPLYRLPPNFAAWTSPHPSRAELEGEDGLLGAKSRLRGLELVWLRDRLEAFLIHVQGSARLQLTDGTVMTVGFAGKTNQPYTGVGRELVKDGKMQLEGLTLPAVIQHFRDFPQDMSRYLPRNRSFVFFRETHGQPATGSLGVPVTGDRSIATDKALMPPGALALIQATLPYPNAQGQLEPRSVNRYVLDQDTGGAIVGTGRVDLFTGTGKLAGDRAGLINSTGQLYYLLLKR